MKKELDKTEMAKKSQPGENIAVVVLGMHRSGTSLVTRLLNLLGASVAKDSPTANKFNARGYWESKGTLKLHDQLFNAAGSSWFDWWPFPVETFPVGDRRRFENRAVTWIQNHFGESIDEPYVVKDPRICKVFPFWHRAFRRLGSEVRVVIPYRHPLAVAQSLRTRDDIPEIWACLLWARHVIDAERFSRDLPRSFVSYDSVVEDCKGSIAKVVDELELPLKPPSDESVGAEMEQFVSAKLRHHSGQPAAENPSGIARLVGELHHLLESCRDGEADTASFDKIAAQIAATERKSGDVVALVIDRYVGQQVALQQVANDQESALRGSLILRSTGASYVGHTLELTDDANNHIGALEKELKQRDITAATKSNALSRTQQKLSDLRDDMEKLQNHASQLDTYNSEIHTKNALLTSELETANLENRGLLNQLASEREISKALGNSLESRIEELEGLLDQQRQSNAADVQNLEMQLKEVRENSDRMLAIEKSKIRTLKERLVENSNKLAFCQEKLADLQACGRITSAQLADREAQIESLRSHLSSMSKRVKKLKVLEQRVSSERQVIAPHTGESTKVTNAPLIQEIESLRANMPSRLARLFGWPGQVLHTIMLRTGRAIRVRRQTKIIRRSDFFDAEWYLETYSDVETEGIDPALHYLLFGASEGRKPGPDFDGREFLLRNPVAAVENINPLVFATLAAARKKTAANQ